MLVVNILFKKNYVYGLVRLAKQLLLTDKITKYYLSLSMSKYFISIIAYINLIILYFLNPFYSDRLIHMAKYPRLEGRWIGNGGCYSNLLYHFYHFEFDDLCLLRELCVRIGCQIEPRPDDQWSITFRIRGGKYALIIGLFVEI